MSFHHAEAASPSLTGIAPVLRSSLNEPAYTRNVNQIFDNMDTDPLIGDTATVNLPACRVELLKRVAPHVSDLPRVRAEVELFCWDHQREGPEFPSAANTTFGRICTFESLANAIADPSSPASLDDARALLRDAIDAPPSPTRFVRQCSDLNGKNLSRFQMWSFPVSDPANPFAEVGTARQEAIDILGLGYINPSDEVVGFAHRLPASTPAHRPTAWDAGCFNCWRIGGRTYRLDLEEYGLLEVVHDRIRGEHLAACIDTFL